LLDDTELGVATVGFAAGFNSVRQMNRAMLQTFRASPRELRARRRRPERLVADGGLEVQLPYKPPIAWDDILAYLAPRATPGVEAVDGGTWRRVVRHEGHPALIEATAHGEHVRVRLHLPSFAGLIHLAAGVRSTFGLDDDVREANAVLRRDPLLRTSMRRRPGLRVPGAWDPFELGVRAIVGQQVSVKSATTIIGRIAERHGEPVDGLGPLGLHRLFPEAEKLAEAGLGGAGLTRTRADAVRAFARACAEGELALDGSWSLGEVVEALEALPGIGGWTAHYIAMRGARERDAFPSGDLGLRRASGLTPAQLERRAEAWRPWRSTAAMHLWLGAAD
jgi:AraC family transcriptional regulator of adaptative response / DNA-3-methyladenine glycosylase II